MQKIVDELKDLITLKNTTNEGDIILIVAQKPQMLMYAFVNEIERDTSRRDEWWHIHFTMLSVPPQKMTWTLRTEQMNGSEIFTMGGHEHFIQALDLTKNESKRVKPRKKPVPAKNKGLKLVK